MPLWSMRPSWSIGTQSQKILSLKTSGTAKLGPSMYSRTELSTPANGKTTEDMVTASRSGPTVPSTRATGSVARPTVRVHLSTSTMISMRDSGNAIRLMVRESILILMVQLTRECGVMTFNMALESKNGQTIRNLRVIITRVKSTVLVLTAGSMAHLTLEIGIKIQSTEKVSINGPMEDPSTVTGSTIKWTVMVFIFGKMAVGMRASTSRTRNMAMVLTPGLMVADTKDSGTMASNTESESTFH